MQFHFHFRLCPTSFWADRLGLLKNIEMKRVLKGNFVGHQTTVNDGNVLHSQSLIGVMGQNRHESFQNGEKMMKY